VMGIEALIRGEMSVRPLQELHAALRAGEVPAAAGGGAA
jgi:carbamoyl-phosphate synthase large subunit